MLIKRWVSLFEFIFGIFEMYNQAKEMVVLCPNQVFSDLEIKKRFDQIIFSAVVLTIGNEYFNIIWS